MKYLEYQEARTLKALEDARDCDLEKYRWSKEEVELVICFLNVINDLRGKIDLYEKTHNKNYVKVVFSE